MQIGMIGLGRMGANMVRRLIKSGHECVVFDRSQKLVQELVCESAVGASDLRDIIEKLAAPRAVWLMVPAAAVDETVADLVPLLEAGDTIVDGGNSYYVDDIRRAKELAGKGIHYIDVGTSGGVWGLERGYCMMIGGEKEAVERLDPIFRTLGPGAGNIVRTPGRGRNRRNRRGGISALRSKRRWPFRQDGAQRNRVRLDGCVCGGFRNPAQGERRKTAANSGCGNDSFARSGALSVRVQSARCSGGVAPRQRGRIVAARFDGCGADGRSGAF